MTQSRYIFAFSTLALLTCASRTNATVLYSNLGPSDTYNTLTGAVVSGDSFGSLQSSAATAFSTGPSNWQVDSLSVAIRYSGGDDSFIISLAKDSSGLPGSILENIALSDIPSDASLLTIPLPTPFTVDPNTTYWITLTGTGTASGEWYAASASSNSSATKLGAANWTTQDFALALKLNGTEVPEPSTLGIAGLLLLTSIYPRIRCKSLATPNALTP